ncbi:sensor histidine kinase [Paenibacillus cremeus]|uniref:Sensor histidine kinase n=1 Tax=Paenibacillus cremeus TaxID=2163881 RepID=A0A559KE18_9BACL|nr:sensor histidine kinase [Paenibacillus cremeus]TVY10375.1 sensor histidine kinase [Paenibacillus cremeus]
MGRNSLRFKLIVLLLIATIAPIVTTMLVTNLYTKQSVKQNAIRESTNLLSQSKLNLINYMNQLNDLTFSMYKNPSFIKLMDLGFTGYEAEPEIYNLMQSIALNKDVYQVYMSFDHRAEGDPLSYLLFNMKKTQQYTVTAPPYPGLKPGSYDSALETTHWSHDYGMSSFSYYAPRQVLTIHRALYRVPSMEALGNLSVDIRLDTLEEMMKQLLSEKEDVYLLDANGNVVYSSAPGAPDGRKLNAPWADRLLNLADDEGSLEDKSSIHMYERIETPFFQWYLVKTIPYEQLYRGARELTQIQFAILAVLLVVVVALTLWITVRFTRPVKQLIGYINKIQTGQLDVDIQVDSKDEIGILARRFRTMMETINHLIMQEYKLHLANKTNQLRALQAQINPHFLYNSLQSIGTLALQHSAPKIYQLLNALAKMMRYSMNTQESVVPLRKELDHIRAYMELQIQRFEDELTVRYHIEEETLDIFIPKMTLQPLVENYFKHGFDPREHPGELTIISRSSLSSEEPYFEIIVENNGRSMSEEEWLRLSKQLAGAAVDDATEHGNAGSETEGSIGLLNVKTRLSLYYNEKAHLFVESKEPCGFQVTLLIPKGEHAS